MKLSLKAEVVSLAVGILGVGVMALSGLSVPLVLSLPTDSRLYQENRLVEKYRGNDTIEQMLRTQGFQTEIGGSRKMEGSQSDIYFVANASESLENACGTTEFMSSPICQDYSLIQIDVAAQRQEAERSALIAMTIYGSGFLFYGAGYALDRASKKSQRQMLPSGV